MKHRRSFKSTADFDFNNMELDGIEPVSESELSGMTLLDKLEHLLDATKNCKLKEEFFQLHANLIQSAANELMLTPSQTVLLCPYINNQNAAINDSDLQRYFGCNPITLMRHNEDLKTLLRRRYVETCNNYNKCLSDKAQRALCENHGLPVIKISGLTPTEFMKQFGKLLVEYGKRNQIDQEEFFIEANELIAANPQLKMIAAVNDLPINNEERIVLLIFCKALVIDGDLGLPLGHFDNYVDDFHNFTEAMFKKSHPFITENLLSPSVVGDLFSRDFYSLTNKARKLLLSEYVIPHREYEPNSFEHAQLIRNKAIKPKTLYYCAEDQGQIDTLKGLLEDKQLKAIRKRLEAANLRKGFNCLFYGLPGTGKTETALQLACTTQRDIMQVDISAMRDKWYGETEKIVRGIFEDYAELVKRSKRIPILLINEADALLSIRTNIGGNNPTIEKTENAIQNILLESMENLDGILIATTNLTCNLDSAFERRFLYKVEFHQPSTEAKMNIWKSFLPSLSEKNAFSLANSFDFSGGQIENIARKVMVNQLLYGTASDLDHIQELCTQETLSGNPQRKRTIGFH